MTTQPHEPPDEALVERLAEVLCRARTGQTLGFRHLSARTEYRDNVRAVLAAVDLPSVRADAERAGAVKALREYERRWMERSKDPKATITTNAIRRTVAYQFREAAAEVESGAAAVEAGRAGQ